MRPKSLLLLALALGCGLVASIGISQVMNDKANRLPAFETTPIYVALHNINTGDPIDTTMVVLQEWPKDRIPRGAIAELSDLEGRRPRTAIIEGEPILEAKLLAPGQVADPIRSIPKGFRLKTIAVDAQKSAAGLLGPGDRVDVQLYVRANRADTARSKVILQNIRVFAIDQTVQRSPDGTEDRTVARTISLLLTPEQASKLTLAENLGTISLIPRNPDDEASSNWAEYTAEDLWQEGGRSSREGEQARGESQQSDELGDAVRTAVVAQPPFRMEIVEAHSVREQLFDAATGRPVRDGGPPPSAGPRVQLPADIGTTDADVSDTIPDDASGALDDFPIDF